MRLEEKNMNIFILNGDKLILNGIKMGNWNLGESIDMDN